MPVTLIVGPPCAGKSTLARGAARPGDVVLDWDAICVELGSSHPWAHSAGIREQAEALMQHRMRRLVGFQGTAYVIRSMPEGPRRAHLAETLSAQVWLVDPGAAECIRRAIADARPRGTTREIRRWYRRFSPSPLDTAYPPA